jgi:hypothetical protein
MPKKPVTIIEPINAEFDAVVASLIAPDALTDGAAWYQYDRAKDVLRSMLRIFIATEVRAWEKTLPDKLWEEFQCRAAWQDGSHLRPEWWNKLVTILIYEALDPEMAKYLKGDRAGAGTR